MGRVQPILRRARTTPYRLVGRLEEAHSPRMGLMVGGCPSDCHRSFANDLTTERHNCRSRRRFHAPSSSTVYRQYTVYSSHVYGNVLAPKIREKDLRHEFSLIMWFNCSFNQHPPRHNIPSERLTVRSISKPTLSWGR